MENPFSHAPDRREYVYLDNAATTPLDGRVAAAMLPYLQRAGEVPLGNPSSLHRSGAVASEAIELARERVAALVGAAPERIVFTSGGTEADNLALFGLARSAPECKRHLVVSQVEHAAVRESVRALEREGFAVTWVGTDACGLVDPEEVRDALRDDTALCALMWANNEIGTVQDVAAVAAICAERGVPFHTDAVQAAGRERLDVSEVPATTLALSAHKLYGPPGAGALYVREDAHLAPLAFGGGQESGLRSGTENVPALAGFGVAARLASEELEARSEHERALRDALIGGVTAVEGVRLNGHPARRLTNNVHLTVPGAESESLVLMLDALGFAVGKGSACSSSGHKASPVLEALGQGPEEAFCALRVTVGKDNTEEEVESFLEAFRECVERLRELAPAGYGAGYGAGRG